MVKKTVRTCEERLTKVYNDIYVTEGHIADAKKVYERYSPFSEGMVYTVTVDDDGDGRMMLTYRGCELTGSGVMLTFTKDGERHIYDFRHVHICGMPGKVPETSVTRLTGLIARLCTLKMKAIRLLNEYTMAHKDIRYYSDGSRYNYIRFIYNDVTYTGHVISAHWESDAEYIREGEFGFGRMIYTVATDDGYADFDARYMKPQAYWPGT